MEQNQDILETKRPILLTIYCVIIVIYCLFQSMGLFLNEKTTETRNVPFDILKIVGVAAIIGIAGAVGIWLMKKWGAYLIFLYLILSRVIPPVLIAGESYSAFRKLTSNAIFVELIIFLFLLVPLIINWKKLK